MNDDNRRKGLGRGLAALLGDDAAANAPQPPRGAVFEVAVEKIRPNAKQPRTHFDPEALQELSDSIREKGILQPILVRPCSGPEEYEIIAGERRWRAAQKAQLHRVPVIMRAISDGEALELALIENIQRRDLNPVEAALGYRRLMDEFGYSQEKVGEMVGKSRSAVANQLRLLTLPEPVLLMLKDGRLTEGHARTVLAADDPLAMAQRIVDAGMTVRQAEEAAAERKRQGKPTGGEKSRPARDADTVALERSLSLATGLAVHVEHQGAGGQVRIAYRSLEQLDLICRVLSTAQTRTAAEEDPLDESEADLLAEEMRALAEGPEDSDGSFRKT
jgi:ParB family chromosome partitioning protein